MGKKNQVGISELEIREIGLWPIEYRMCVIIIVCCVALAVSYLLILKDNLDKLSSFASQKQKLLATFAENFQQSANLDAYKQQMIDIQKMLQALLKKLPSKGEIPILLEDISQQALAAGLTFELIKPEDPIDKGFYVEQPIKMILVGKYHGFGKFAAGIAKLPRIVTLHDFSVAKKSMQDHQDGTSMLSLEVYAKTYWYVAKEQL